MDASTCLDALRSGVTTDCAADTERLGQHLARALPPDVILALSGQLGAGKTALVRGIAAGLGINATVNSPTYTLCHVFHGPLRQLVHIDAYRLQSADALDALSLDDLLAPPFLIAIEWPEHIHAFLNTFPTFYIAISQPSPTQRCFVLRTPPAL